MYPFLHDVIRAHGSMEPAAEGNCDALISRAMSISPGDIDVRISLASIRMSQQRFDEAKEIALKLYEEIDEKEPCKFATCRCGLDCSHLSRLGMRVLTSS